MCARNLYASQNSEEDIQDGEIRRWRNIDRQAKCRTQSFSARTHVSTRTQTGLVTLHDLQAWLAQLTDAERKLAKNL